MKVIILAGGSGTRLWPFSRETFPKQFLHFGDGQSLLQKTIARFYPTHEILIVTTQNYFELVQAQASSIDPNLEIIVEPVRKNTAPAILFAVQHLLSQGTDPKSCFLVSSSDHLIFPSEPFVETLPIAEKLAQTGHHVVFGVAPTKPETGYGYINADAKGHVLSFIEKPNLETAQKYIDLGYWWNSGIFLFQIETFLEELQQYCPELFHPDAPEISIDYALMEHSLKSMLMPLNSNWSDVGSWESVYDSLEKDLNLNVKRGNILDINTKNCLILGGKKLISTIGLEDLIVVETDDAIFIGKKNQSQQVKKIVEELKKRHAKEC